jgi:OmpA-OmpF porin, OOP family
MSFNILDAVKNHLTPELISKSSSFLGESEGGVKKAISGILPVLVSGFIAKASTGGSGNAEMYNTAQQVHKSNFLGGLGNVFNDGGGMLNKGVDLLKGLFGDKLSGIIATISSFAGIKLSSASSLLSMAAPVTAGTLGKHAAENNLDASGLASLLSNQKSAVLDVLPAGLGGLTSMLGLSKAVDAPSAITSKVHEIKNTSYYHASDADTKSGGFSWLAWFIPVLLAAALAWWFLLGGKSNCNGSGSGTTESDTTTVPVSSDHDGSNPQPNTVTETLPAVTVDTLTGVVYYDLGKDIEYTLPNGTKFMAAENGFESQLLSFIQHGTIDTINKSANWYNMFDVQFKTGGNTYTGKAEAMLNNAAAILKAYPAVKIKLGGYTDNTGAAEVNKKVSQQRADKVKADLIKMGVAADQVTEAIGYGPEFPVCEANDTPECKARNRRVACKVAVK